MRYKNILFDLDGTLIDTNELIHLSYDFTMKQYGYNFTREELLKFNGPPLQDVFSGVNPAMADEMVETYIKHNHAHHDAYVKAFPYVMETLDQLKNKGIKMAIVSSKRRTGVEMGLKVTNLRQYFEEIVAVDDVVKPKPDAESVLKAMQLLKGTPADTLMVGDNFQDILSGQHAGVDTAGVAWSSKGAAYLESYKPTCMLKDMRDLVDMLGV